MATGNYTPTAAFDFGDGGNYTPLPVFDFRPSANALAIACQLGQLSAQADFTVINNNAFAIASALGALQCDALFTVGDNSGYTPTAVFNFGNGGNYTPTAVFNFGGVLEPVSHSFLINATLDALTAVADFAIIAPNALAIDWQLGSLTADASFTVSHDTSWAIEQTLGALSAQATFAPVVDFSVVATLGTLSAVVFCDIDINVKRVTHTQAVCTVQDAKAVFVSTQAAIKQIQRADYQANATLSHALAISHAVNALPKPVVFVSNGIDAVQHSTIALFNAVASLINVVTLLRQRGCFTQSNALAISNTTQSVQDYLTFVINQSQGVQADMYRRHYSVLKRFIESLNPYTPAAVFSFTDTDYIPAAVFSFEGVFVDICEAVVSGVLSTAVDSNIAVSALTRKKLCALLADAIKPAQGKSTRIDKPRPPRPPYPPDHLTITIPTHRVYTVNHSIIVKTVIGNNPVPLSKLSLSYDADSFAWMFSGVLVDKSALALVTMTGNDPVQLSITIDGYEWIVIVESIEQSRSFGNLAINLKGRSLSALLGSPYQVQISYTSGSDSTVQQIAESLLPTGWTLDWQCAEPWLVPANAYSFNQQTIIQALAQLAQDIGAVLIPSKNAQVLTIKPRYPVLPWQFNDVGISPDLIVPEAAIITVNTQSRTQSPINGVYVHGGQNGGVLAFCRLNGTAGDVLAPTSSNNLITDVTAARALGERILAGMATQPIISGFTMPLGGDFVLASVGQLVQVMGERAIINSVAISVEFGKVSQSIGIGENTNNAYSKLMHLLPAQPLLVGKVSAVSGDIAILTLLDNGVITARGTGVVGSNYYVRNGLIESAAPNLTLEEIVI